jgi:hypothetical protein
VRARGGSRDSRYRQEGVTRSEKAIMGCRSGEMSCPDGPGESCQIGATVVIIIAS